MRLVMAMKVRDEDDVLEHNLRYHRAQGVDHFIVTDNGSTDGTSQILRRYEAAGLLTLIEEPSTDEFRDQAHWWVTRMARMAATELEADWVVHVDADEFWSPVAGTLKQALQRIPESYGVVLAPRPEFVPRPDGPGEFWERLTIREARSRLRPKIAHRGEPDVILHRGAHDVDVEGDEGGVRHSGRAVMRAVKPDRAADGGRLVWAPAWPARVLHLPLRSFDQYRRKVEVTLRGGFEDRAHDDLRRAREEGRLPELYAKLVPDDAAVEAGLREGRLVEDRRLRDLLERAPDPLAEGAGDAEARPAADPAAAEAKAEGRPGRDPAEPEARAEGRPATHPAEPEAEAEDSAGIDVERDLAELRLDAMQTLARTQRSLIRQLDALRRRLAKQRKRLDRAEGGRNWSRLRSGAARLMRQSQR